MTARARGPFVAAAALWAVACASCGASTVRSDADAAAEGGAETGSPDVAGDGASEGGGDAPPDLAIDAADAPLDLAIDAADAPLDLAPDGADAPLDLRADGSDDGGGRPGDADGGGGDAPAACGTGPLTACTCGAACTGGCARLCNVTPAGGICRDPANGTCECGGVLVDNCVKPAARCLCPSCSDAPGALCVTDAQRAALCAGPNAAAFRCD